MSKSKLRRYVFCYAMLSIAVAHFIVFWLIVNFNSILIAFQQSVDGVVRYSFDNFRWFFRELARPDTIMFDALKNTFIFFTVSLVGLLPLSTFFAYFLFKRLLGYKVFRFIFMFPMICSAVVLVAVFKNIFGPGGPIAQVYEAFTNKPAPLFLRDSRYALGTMILYNIWTGFGLNLVLISGAMNRLPESVIESGRLEGIKPMRELISVVIPMIWPTISTLIITTCTGLFTSSGPILLFTQGRYNTYTISFWIFWEVYNYSSYEYASAVGLFFTMLGLPVTFLVRHFIGKVWRDVEW